MSYDNLASTNKHPKIVFGQYLYNPSEPADNIMSDSRVHLDAELWEASYYMKRRFRRIAHKLRSKY